MKLSIELEMPPPSKEKPEPVHKQSVEERVRECLECVESGRDSHKEWLILSNLYKALLNTKKKSPRGKNILKMIEPVMTKYGYAGVGGNT